MPACIVSGCKNNSNNLVKWREETCALHRVKHRSIDCTCIQPLRLYPFPRAPEMRHNWLKLLNVDRSEFDALKTRDKRVCSIHFTDGDGHNYSPTLNLPTQNIDNLPVETTNQLEFICENFDVTPVVRANEIYIEATNQPKISFSLSKFIFLLLMYLVKYLWKKNVSLEAKVVELLAESKEQIKEDNKYLLEKVINLDAENKALKRQLRVNTQTIGDNTVFHKLDAENKDLKTKFGDTSHVITLETPQDIQNGVFTIENSLVDGTSQSTNTVLYDTEEFMDSQPTLLLTGEEFTVTGEKFTVTGEEFTVMAEEFTVTGDEFADTPFLTETEVGVLFPYDNSNSESAHYLKEGEGIEHHYALYTDSYDSSQYASTSVQEDNTSFSSIMAVGPDQPVRDKLMQNFCNICGENFVTLAKLNLHRKVHLPKKYIYACSICNITFRESEDYSAHMEIHEKPHKCDICQKSFQYNSSLVMHAFSHKEHHFIP